jgi:hypothetical protein
VDFARSRKKQRTQPFVALDPTAKYTLLEIWHGESDPFISGNYLPQPQASYQLKLSFIPPLLGDLQVMHLFLFLRERLQKLPHLHSTVR